MQITIRFLFACCLTLLFAFTAHPEGLSARLKFGYSFHNMRDLQSINTLTRQVYRNELGINARTVESFPPYWDYQFQILVTPDERNAVGVFGGFTSTGSRLHYGDYSGELRFDQRLQRYAYGLHAERSVNPKDRVRFVGILRLFVIKSSLELIEALSIEPDIEESNSFDFQATGFAIEPGVAVQLRVSGFFSLRTELSYEALLHNNAFHLKNSESMKLLNEAGTPLGPEWSGVRIGFLVVFDFNRPPVDPSGQR